MNNYWKYLVKKQKSLVIIYTVICVVLFLFPILFSLPLAKDTYTLVDNAHRQVGYMLQKLAVVLVPMMLVLPIFNYRFILNKKTADVYLTLPIKRGTLFTQHYVVSLLMAILPPMLITIISYVVLMVTSNQGLYVMKFWMEWTIFVISASLVLYALITFIIMKTNNVLDASLMSVSYVIVPLIVVSAVETFMRRQTFIYDLPIFDLVEKFSFILSPILLIVKTIGHFIYNSPLMVGTLVLFRVLFGYDFGVLISRKKEFERKKGEDAEQITTHWLTYPLIGNVLSVCLISFIGFSSDITFTIVLLTIIFIIYAIIHFIASKSVRFTPQLLIKFVVLIALFTGFSYLSKKTEFFGMNRQLVNLEDVKTIEVRTSIYDGKTGEWQEYYLNIPDINQEKELVKQLQNYQLIASERFKEQLDLEYLNSFLNVTFKMNDGENKTRDYSCFTQSELNSIIAQSQNLHDENLEWK